MDKDFEIIHEEPVSLSEDDAARIERELLTLLESDE